MTEEMRIVWVDDDVTHKKDATFIEEKCEKLRVDFFHPKEFNVKNNPADLFLIDDRLYQLANKDNEHSNKQGLTLAAEIRVNFPEIPIYIFTNDYFSKGIFGSLSQATEGLADEKIFYKDIQRQGPQILYNDTLDYKRVREIERLNYKQLVGLLNPPEDSMDDLLNGFPEILKGGLRLTEDTEKAAGNSLFYAKWIKKALLAFPGYVYDSLFAATSVGLKEELFEKTPDFDNARYTGVFAHSRKPLWWKRKLNQILMNEAQKSLKLADITNLFSIAEKIYKLRDVEQLRCAVCNDKFPETVAYNKEDENERQPVHFSCSCVDYRKENKLFYDEIRFFEYKD